MNNYKGISDLGEKEKNIMEKILEVLKEHKQEYKYNPDDNPKCVDVWTKQGNKSLRMVINMERSEIIFFVYFPLEVQINAIALIAIYIAKYNNEYGEPRLNLNMHCGELKMEFPMRISDYMQFNKDSFRAHMNFMIEEAFEKYTVISGLSMGVVPYHEKVLYKELLEMSVDTIEGDYSEEEISFGTEELESVLYGEKKDFRKVLGEYVNEENYENKDRNNCSTRAKLPTFEEFLRVKKERDSFYTEVKNSKKIVTGNVVRLEDNRLFQLIEETEIEKRKFVYAVKLLQDKSVTEEYEVFEAGENENGEFLKDVEDCDLYNRLLDSFEEIFQENLRVWKYIEYGEDINSFLLTKYQPTENKPGEDKEEDSGSLNGMKMEVIPPKPFPTRKSEITIPNFLLESDGLRKLSEDKYKYIDFDGE